MAWDLIKGFNCETLSEKINLLNNLGFIPVPFAYIPSNAVNKDYINTTTINTRKNYGFKNHCSGQASARHPQRG